MNFKSFIQMAVCCDSTAGRSIVIIDNTLYFIYLENIYLKFTICDIPFPPRGTVRFGMVFFFALSLSKGY